jgi:hypothetical protein
MIHTDKHLESTRKALAHLEAAMAALRRDKPTLHPDRYALMAAPLLDEIRQLRQQIDEYIGVADAAQAIVPLWLRLLGQDIELGSAPSSVVTATIDLLRVGVQAIAEFTQRGAVGSRPTDALKKACDLRLVGWAPGSVQVGLQLPELEAELFLDGSLAQQANKALELYLRVAGWAGSADGVERLENDVPDQETRRLVLNQVARLIPRPRGLLESIELTGRVVPHGPIQLRREALARVRAAITRVIHENLVEVEGTLREIDLDVRIFTLRNLENGNEQRCSIAPEDDDLLAIAADALDHRVHVVGVQRRDPGRRQVFPLQVSEIDVLDAAEMDLAGNT